LGKRWARATAEMLDQPSLKPLSLQLRQEQISGLTAPSRGRKQLLRCLGLSAQEARGLHPTPGSRIEIRGGEMKWGNGLNQGHPGEATSSSLGGHLEI
jgi:hypothetical protein